MKKYLVRAYFKARILVPFYTASVFSLFSVAGPDCYEVLEIAFYSGLTGICSLTIFLNCYRKIADNYVYSALSWSLLPLLFMVYVLSTKVNWAIFKDMKKGSPFVTSLYLVIFFLHVIGLVISFQSFRATVIRNQNEAEIMNEVEEPGAKTSL